VDPDARDDEEAPARNGGGRAPRVRERQESVPLAPDEDGPLREESFLAGEEL